MNIEQMTVEQIADVVGGMAIESTINLDSMIIHKGAHPKLGKIVAVSNAFGPNMVVRHSNRPKAIRLDVSQLSRLDWIFQFLRIKEAEMQLAEIENTISNGRNLDKVEWVIKRWRRIQEVREALSFPHHPDYRTA